MVAKKTTKKSVNASVKKTVKKVAVAKPAAAKVILTKKAAEKITELAAKDGKKGYGLKLYVFPGGCSGFQYGLDFEKAQADTDIVFEQHGVKLFVDKESMEFLKGTTIDYVDGLQGSGFKIENPNVQHSCGCGKSFC